MPKSCTPYMLVKMRSLSCRPPWPATLVVLSARASSAPSLRSTCRRVDSMAPAGNTTRRHRRATSCRYGPAKALEALSTYKNARSPQTRLDRLHDVGEWCSQVWTRSAQCERLPRALKLVLTRCSTSIDCCQPCGHRGGTQPGCDFESRARWEGRCCSKLVWHSLYAIAQSVGPSILQATLRTCCIRTTSLPSAPRITHHLFSL